MFRVYQCEINDARYHEVNAKGWGGVDWGSAYMAATFGTKDEGGLSADALVINAAAKSLYVHTKTVHLEDKEKVFEVLNIGADNYDEIVEDFQLSKSMSVGDVLVTPDHQGWFCDKWGFKKIEDWTVEYLESKTVTHVKMEEVS